MSKKRKRHRARVRSVNRMATDAVELLEKIRIALEALTSIAASLQALSATYNLLQADGQQEIVMPLLTGRRRGMSGRERVEQET